MFNAIGDRSLHQALISGAKQKLVIAEKQLAITN
jgi:hypothetical protein